MKLDIQTGYTERTVFSMSPGDTFMQSDGSVYIVTDDRREGYINCLDPENGCMVPFDEGELNLHLVASTITVQQLKPCLHGESLLDYTEKMSD